MKRKFFKRITAMVLTTAMFIGMITVMTVSTAARTFNVPSSGITLSPGSTYTAGSVYMYAGDRIRFNASYTPSSGRRVEYGIENLTGPPTSIFLTTTNGSMTGTVEATSSGPHIIIVKNSANSGGNITLAGGTCTYTDRSVTHNARIRYDDYIRARPDPVAYSTTNFNQATNGITDTFGIRFSLTTVQYSSLLNGSQCPNTPGTSMCNTHAYNPPTQNGCGALLTCSWNHHKSNIRLLELLHLSSSFTVRVVGHSLCAVKVNTPHYDVSGSGWYTWQHTPPRRDTIATTISNFSLPIIIQHELSHNLGAQDCGNRCIMNDENIELNRWCTTCKGAIKSYK